VVTTYPVLSPVSDETLEGEMLRAHLHRAGVRVVHATTITEIAPGPDGGGPWTAAGHDRYGDPWSAGCDGVVLVTQQASEDGLYLELTGDPAALAAAGIGAVYRIGDAVAPRLLSEAIFDGHRLAREIDSPDPAVPLPFRRERPDLA
jgi:dimethylamine/trimethylamine dehydrogenase